MSETQARPNEVILKGVRISFAYLQEERVDKDTGEKTGYSVQVLIDKNTEQGQANELTYRRAIKAGLIKKFGEDKKNWPQPFGNLNFNLGKDYSESNSFPLRDGDAAAKDESDHRVGHSYFNAKNKQQPTCGVVKGNGWQKLPKDRIAEILYSGCYADVVVDCYGYSSEKGKGVTTNLRAVMRRTDLEGERLSGYAPVDMDSYYSGGQQGDYVDDEFSSGSNIDDLI